MTLSVKPVRIHGFEMWAVIVGGEMLRTFFSQEQANAKVLELKKKWGLI